MSDQPKSEAEVFTIARTFDAPIDLFWDVWTQGEHLAAFFGPPGTTVQVKSLDLKPGGVFLYGMTMPGGIVMWGKWVYREVVKPNRLSYVVSFCNEQGEPVRHPMAPLWPLEVLAVMTMIEKDGKTTMESRSWPINATPEERAVFQAGHASMQMGFGGTFLNLDAYLARLKA